MYRTLFLGRRRVDNERIGLLGRFARAEIEGRVLPQNRLLQLTKLPAGVDSEFLRQRAACVLVGLQRLRLATER